MVGLEAGAGRPRRPHAHRRDDVGLRRRADRRSLVVGISDNLSLSLIRSRRCSPERFSSSRRSP
jgi:hypothetical protein